MLCPFCQADNPDQVTRCQTCGGALGEPDDSSDEPLPPGTMLQGNAYSIDRVLGQGGFGITYIGSDNSLSRAVAIKEFFPAGCYRKESTVQPGGTIGRSAFHDAKTRFLDEAKNLARFRHPGIVNVHTAFEENNSAYMVMEYLHGQNLGTVVRDRGEPLPQDEALGFIREAGEALELVHASGLLHRDIKPENLMQCQDGRIVLIDFGTARDFSSGATQGHTVVVTPGYAPLEQYAQRAQRGAFSDVYGLGATLYFLLSGEAPPAATDRAAGVELVPPHLLIAAVEPHIGEAVQWAMELKVDSRPQTVREFLNALDGTSQPVIVPTIEYEQSVEDPAFEQEVNESDAPPYLPWRAEQTPYALPTLHTFDIHTNSHDPIRLQWPQRCACCGAASDTFHTLVYMPNDQPARWQSWYVPYCSPCVQHVEASEEEKNRMFTIAPAVGLATVVGAGGACLAAESLAPLGLWFLVVMWYVGKVLKRPRQSVADTLHQSCSSRHSAVTCTNVVRGPNDEIVFTLYFANPQYQAEFEHLNRAYKALP